MEWYGRFLLENRENRTKGENRLAIGTKQVQDEASKSEMVQISKSLSPAFQAFHHAKVEMLRLISRNRRDYEHWYKLHGYKVHGQRGGGCATKEA